MRLIVFITVIIIIVIVFVFVVVVAVVVVVIVFIVVFIVVAVAVAVAVSVASSPPRRRLDAASSPRHRCNSCAPGATGDLSRRKAHVTPIACAAAPDDGVRPRAELHRREPAT